MLESIKIDDDEYELLEAVNENFNVSVLETEFKFAKSIKIVVEYMKKEYKFFRTVKGINRVNIR